MNNKKIFPKNEKNVNTEVEITKTKTASLTVSFKFKFDVKTTKIGNREIGSIAKKDFKRF
tara:strand:+ start:323 stop:502 length:180 start_codon:yes stop_codon:yes gene_type:complete